MPRLREVKFTRPGLGRAGDKATPPSPECVGLHAGLCGHHPLKAPRLDLRPKRGERRAGRAANGRARRGGPGTAGVPTQGGRASRGSMRTAAGGHRLPHVHARDTHAHTHARGAVPVASFLGDSAQLESHTSEPPRASSSGRGESEEEREPLGRQEVHQASGYRRRSGRRRKAGEGRGVISWPRAGCWAWARVITEAGTQPAGTGIMRCLPKCRNPLERRILHNPCLERGPRVITAWRKQPGPFPLVMWVGGWPHRAWWLSGSSPGQRAQQRGPGTSNIRVREPEAGLQSWGTTPLGSDVLSSPGPSPTQCGRQIPAEWQEAS